MKKTLVILLALIMATSVAVTACEEESSNNTESQYEMIFDDSSSNVVTDESGNEVVSTDESGNTNTDTPGVATDGEVVNDTIYVLHSAAIREKSSKKATNTTAAIGSIPFGASAKRTWKGEFWSKITYETNGKTVEGYVSNQLITSNIDTVTFIKQEIVTGEGENQTVAPVVSKLKADPQNYRLREYPLAKGYPHDVTIEIAAEKGQVAPGTEVTVLEVSKDEMWAKIRVEAGKLNILNDKGSYGTVEAKDQKFSSEAAEGYVLYSYLEIAETNNSTNNDGPVAG